MYRKAKIEDFDRIMEIYAYAQDFMATHGNPNQWRHAHPSPDLIKQDINDELCNLLYDEEGIYGVFFYLKDIDPTYNYIEDGNWINDEEYGVIHRIASDGTHKGVLREAIGYARSFCPNVRIDTHEDNYVMQNALESLGFTRCGIIYLEDGDPRIAFHKKCDEDSTK